MRSETRANLIFIALLLAIVVPGATMLVRRTLRNGGREFLPPPVRHSFVYFDSTQRWSGLDRVTPPGVGRYVQRLGARLATMQPGLESVVGDADFSPVMSDGLHLQLVALGGDGDNFRVGMIGWGSAFAPLPDLYTITGRRGDAKINGTMTDYEPQNMPIELRTELQDWGYVLPPDGLLWMIVTFPGGVPIESMTLHFKLDRDVIDDTIAIPPSSPTTQPTQR